MGYNKLKLSLIGQKIWEYGKKKGFTTVTSIADNAKVSRPTLYKIMGDDADKYNHKNIGKNTFEALSKTLDIDLPELMFPDVDFSTEVEKTLQGLKVKERGYEAIIEDLKKDKALLEVKIAELQKELSKRK